MDAKSCNVALLNDMVSLKERALSEPCEDKTVVWYNVDVLECSVRSFSVQQLSESDGNSRKSSNGENDIFRPKI